MCVQMATVSATVPWIVEDDLLLKNAVEAGASLEALAKGAVTFSRRFTFQELRDRWHSLLYDPEISAQACARMVDLENSGLNSSLKIDKLKGNGTGPEKRKIGSIRREYYAMRKRIRSELFNSNDLGFLPEPDLHDCGDHGVDFQEHLTHSNSFELQETDLDILRQAFPDTLEGFTALDAVNNTNNHQNIYGFDEQRGADNVLFETDDSQVKSLPVSCPMTNNKRIQQFNSPDSDDNPSCHMMDFSPLRRLPLWKTMEDISAPAMPETVENMDTTNVVESTSEVPEGVDPSCESPTPCDGTHPQNPGFIHPTGVSEGEFVDISDSLLNFGNEDDLLFMDVNETGKDPVEKSCFDQLQSIVLSSPNNLKVNESQNIKPEPAVAQIKEPEETGPFTVPVDELAKIVPHVEVSMPSASEEIFCVLNTEDTEIPCNDDIFLLIHLDRSIATSAKQTAVAETSEPLSSSAEEDCEKGLKVMKGNAARSLPEKAAGRSFLGHFVKPELTGHSKKGLGGYNHQKSTYGTPISAADGMLVEDLSKSEQKTSDKQTAFRGITSNTEASSSKPESVKRSTSDQDEPESDEDVPYFSDIEAMILEMDLGPYDEEPLINKKVSKYKLPDNQRRIMRLEQCARAALHRAMTSQGALAVLYGRHLKHYVRKTEVVIGRSTEDVDVDVDLRKEGRANKISRRQAIIKMEANGSFSIKNLGKSSISVNGKSVATGHLLTLTSSCLIEIRGMSFVFEINDKYVRRHLENNPNTDKKPNKMSKFEWTSEGKP